MPGLCGWIDARAGLDGRSKLSHMANGLVLRAGERLLQWEDGWAGLAVLAREDDRLHAGDRFVVAITGMPRWADDRDEAKARALGRAKSIATCWEREGRACLEQIKGSFSLAVIDKKARSLFLAIDRVGIDPMCHGDVPDGCVFATTTDAVAAYPSLDPKVDAQGLYRYAMNYVSPAPGTVYRGINKLLSGHSLSHNIGRGSGRSGSTSIHRYWQTPYQPDGAGDMAALSADLKAHLAKSVDRAIDAGVAAQDTGAVGAFLSGGLDSSTVCGFLGASLDRPAPAYTIVFEDDRYNEGPYAQLAARHFGLAHREYCLKPQDVVDILPEIVRVFDEPFGNSSVIPATFCARMAKTDVSLLLAGDGGDELFAGNQRYADQTILSHYHKVPALLRVLGEPILDRIPEPLAIGPIGKAKRYSQRARLPMPERMHNPGIYHRSQLSRVFTEEMLAQINVEEPYDLWAQHYKESETDDMLASMLHMDMRITLADNDIRKVNGACLLADIDVAYPMLDDDLIDFAAKVPSRLLLSGTRLRHFFKESMKGFLPDAILNKKKQGFGMPFSEWTKSYPPLRDIAVDCLQSLGKRGVFRADFLEGVIAAHAREGAAITDYIVWDLIMLELWLRDRKPRMV
ncbi:amidotransferase 1, exosortase A system-associated [Iodidimonas gelatinilytica]|uniref:asparagine synthase (glutamine-hydrolyzing) n=1 Tax=Iodidimonas gelatinilytica TaxID=1236966 RepID=A0A5A7MY09_9PROT|nr:asparagine synthase-related protein [Iodidimonas gelatinilytica]GER00214.1 amidotransferase 1, exosortase A system-associated [Iodidimonas gelatinilytica]